jgi:hypothetical protein
MRLGIRFTSAVGRSTCTSPAIGRALQAAVVAVVVGSGCVHPAALEPPPAPVATEPYQVRILDEALRRLAAMGKDAAGFRVIIADRLRHDDAEILAEKGIAADGGIWRVSFVPDVSWSTVPVPTQAELPGEVTFYFRQPSAQAFAVRDDDDDDE